MKKLVKITVRDNWADEMELEYVRTMPLSQWKRLEARLSKFRTWVDISVGSNESVEYENGADYLEHCSVGDAESEMEPIGNWRLDPETVCEAFVESEKEAKADGIENARSERLMLKLYRDVEKLWKSSSSKSYGVVVEFDNQPRGTDMYSKFFEGDAFRLNRRMVEIESIGKDGAFYLKTHDLLEIEKGDERDGIHKFLKSWRMNGNWGKDVGNMTVLGNPFLRRLDSLAMLANDGMRMPVENAVGTVESVKEHILEIVCRRFFVVFGAKEEAEAFLSAIDRNEQSYWTRAIAERPTNSRGMSSQRGRI